MSLPPSLKAYRKNLQYLLERSGDFNLAMVKAVMYTIRPIGDYSIVSYWGGEEITLYYMGHFFRILLVSGEIIMNGRITRTYSREMILTNAAGALLDVLSHAGDCPSTQCKN